MADIKAASIVLMSIVMMMKQCAEITRQMSRHWHRTMETSLFATTGQSNKTVIDNLTMLAKTIDPAKICIRLPLIPKYNTEKDRQESCLYIWRNICAPLKIEAFEYIRC